MTQLTSTDYRPQTRPRPASGRPVLFAALLVLAALCVFAVLLMGPTLPVAASVLLSGAALVLVIGGWVAAGPRW